MAELRDLLSQAAERVADYRERLPEMSVAPAYDVDEVRAAVGGAMPDQPRRPDEVVDQLARAAEPALVATAGPRYFGFVNGGSLDAAVGADLLTTGWDQNAALPVMSPAAAIVEEVVGVWLKDLLGLPAGASFGLVTGGQEANTVGLAAARHHVLDQAGWDVEADGLAGAPPIRVAVGAERHVTIDRALRVLGLGTRSVHEVSVDANGAMDIDRLDDELAKPADRPTIVCLQAGNVNTGAVDDLARGCATAHRRGAWVHVDGAFGLWAAASSATRRLVSGIEQADSWATDGHKWLNVPYDSGFAFCAHPDAHRAATSFAAAYLPAPAAGGLRAPFDYVLNASRRARGFPVWAALQQLGRSGLAELVERCCRLARRFAAALHEAEGFEVANDIVLNQVLVRFRDDSTTDRLIEAVQHDGTCWLGGTTWRGKRYMRISVSNWSTTEADVDRSVAAIMAAAARSGPV